MEAAARGTSTGCTSPDPGWTTRQTRGRRRKDGTDVCSRLVVAIVGQNKRDAWDLVRQVCRSASLDIEQALADGQCNLGLGLNGKRTAASLRFAPHASPGAADTRGPSTFARTAG
ncbi:hypothetical protein FNF31_03101 [Cafeteria roenbergensis]|nr:hypothetical protein FNF31_03101 [Cafeteria roenbergensis]KAA0169690.1 hypothetical protein FNF28_01968 [Cafeteria roenbergensis]